MNDWEDRFWTFVDKKESYECWNWLGALRNGYGIFTIHRDAYSAHRLSWELSRKVSVPDGKIILHLCDNSACCNPNHLICGTHKDNTTDMVAKGRCKRSKLTTKEILEIRNLKGKKSTRDIASIYGTNHTYTLSIWKKDKILNNRGEYV